MDQECQTSGQHCDIRPHRKWRNHSETKWFYWAREQCNFELQTYRQKCVFKSFYVTMLPPVWFSSLAMGLEEYDRLQHSLAQGHQEALVSAQHNMVRYRALSCRGTAAGGAAVYRIAKMNNSIRKGFNSKVLLLLQMSVCADKRGIMGINSKIISSRWRCGFEYLQCNDSFDHPEAAARASAIEELMNINLPGFSTDEIADILVDIACY